MKSAGPFFLVWADAIAVDCFIPGCVNGVLYLSIALYSTGDVRIHPTAKVDKTATVRMLLILVLSCCELYM